MELSSAPCLSPTNIEELNNGYPPFRKELSTTANTRHRTVLIYQVNF